MDMPGPPTVPIDSVVAVDGKGRVSVFADKLWAVMGLEWADGTLYVVHPPFLSALRDTDGDGKADSRVDLMTGLGPKLPGFSGINDHVASGVRLGMDGFLYIAVGDKGIPRGVGKDGTTISLFGGGVIRIRPDGTGLEVVSTGERNPLTMALTATDEVFTYGNDDDSKKWPNSLTHHIVGGHYGYPYQFLDAPHRALPIVAGQLGGSGAQGVCYNEDGLPASYRGNLFVCDWGVQTVFRYTIERQGGTFRVKARTPFVTKGDLDDFRPFSMAVLPDGLGFYLIDWAFSGWLAAGPQTGRVYRLTYTGADKPAAAPRPSGDDPATLVKALDHPALSVRLEAQRRLVSLASRAGGRETGVRDTLAARLRQTKPVTGRLHALWALDRLGESAAGSIREALAAPEAEVRLQAARSAGIRRDRGAVAGLIPLLKDKDAAVRREAAIALGKAGDPSAGPALMAALGDPDRFAAWSIRRAIRTLGAWDAEALTAALLDPKRRDAAITLCDESWAGPVVDALAKALAKIDDDATRARMVGTLAGLYRKYPEWTGNWFGTNPLAGQFPQKTRPWDPSAMARVQAGLTLALKDASPAVRLQAIAGLFAVARPALPALREALGTETDPRNLEALAQGLGVLGDFMSAQPLGAIVLDPKRPEPVRVAALDALGRLRGPQALTARVSLVYDAAAPASLVARALPSLGRDGVVPPNDLAGFLEHADPSVRAAALAALVGRKAIPEEVRTAVLDRLDDPKAEVRRAAIEAVAAMGMRGAVPKLLAAAMKDETRSEAVLALAAMPDPQALPVYLDALQDRSPEIRKAGEVALLAVRDSVSADLEKAARSGRYGGPAALALRRVLTRFKPVIDWKVIGPFARTTAQVFLGEASIDFGRTHSGAEGRTIAWAPRKADSATGRVVVDDLKHGAGDRGGFGYDTNGSPDVAAFGYAEIDSDRDRDALLLVGSSGTAIITVNEQVVFRYVNFAGRAYEPDSDLVPIRLQKGKNRLLVMSRQGIGVWSFGVQVSEPSTVEVVASASKTSGGPEALRAFALTRDGDPKGGEALFFDAKGIGCVKCHSANGRGTANIGPDLTGLALKYDRAEIIRSVLEPSNRIATGYQPVLLATQDGKVVNGLARAETEAYVELVDSEARIVRVPKDQIEERRVGDVSIMPTGLVESLSVVEFADLISYLQSLKAAPAPAGH
jgi:putative membrane-bound dehydrogenase-like protein